MAKAKRYTVAQVVAEEYRDSDGYWIYLKPGFRSGQDPAGCVHGIVEDTKRDARSWIPNTLTCDCAECLALIAAAKGGR
jgi:hypothetical protein